MRDTCTTVYIVLRPLVKVCCEKAGNIQAAWTQAQDATGCGFFCLSGKQTRCKQVNHVEWWVNSTIYLPLVPTCHVTSFQHASGTSRQGRAGENGEFLAPSAQDKVRAVLGLGNRHGSKVRPKCLIGKTVWIGDGRGVEYTLNSEVPEPRSELLSGPLYASGFKQAIVGQSLFHQHRQMLTLLIFD